MRRAVAQVMEVLGAACVVACTYGLLGLWAAVGVAGGCLLAASVVIGR